MADLNDTTLCCDSCPIRRCRYINVCPVTFSWQPRFTEQWKAKHFVSILCQEAAVGPRGRYCRLSRFTPVIYLINEKLQVWGPNRRASKPRTCTKELLKWAGECAHEVRQRGTLKYSRQGRSNQGGADSHSQERGKSVTRFRITN